MSNKTLKTEEARNAAAIERDVATGVSPTDDPATLTKMEDLERQDPTYGAKIDQAIAKGDAEWAAKHGGEHSPVSDQALTGGVDPLAALVGGESGPDDE